MPVPILCACSVTGTGYRVSVAEELIMAVGNEIHEFIAAIKTEAITDPIDAHL